jgi:phospholipase/lecithinase/hemolysin
MKRLLLAAALLTISWDADAQAMECGTRLITQGDSISKVASLCGNPTQVDRTSIVRSVSRSYINGQWLQSGGAQIEIPVEVWLYNLGPDRLMRQIRFEDGRVVKIETLDYGYLEKS